MKRREFIAGLSATALPLAARAQQPAMPAVGLLRFQPLDSMRDPMAAFHRGLADSGYVEGRIVCELCLWLLLISMFVVDFP